MRFEHGRREAIFADVHGESCGQMRVDHGDGTPGSSRHHHRTEFVGEVEATTALGREGHLSVPVGGQSRQSTLNLDPELDSPRPGRDSELILSLRGRTPD